HRSRGSPSTSSKERRNRARMPRTRLRPTPPGGCAACSPTRTAGPSRPSACSPRSPRPSTVSGPRRRSRTAAAVLAGTRLAPAASATAKLHATPSGLAIELDVSKLPPSPPGFYYQAWMKGPHGLVTIGTFHMRGPGTVELWSAVSLADYPTITVTREPEDGNPASSGQVVLTSRHP